MEFLIKNYTKYKWFYTSTSKLVIGGKSAEQNDLLLKLLKRSKKAYLLMHTSEPGSPFSVILDDPKSITDEDIKEAALFTGCFSRAWRSGKSKATIDIFKLSQLYKSNSMKTGTWGIKGKIDRKEVDLSLVFTKQNGFLRAVPQETVKNKEDILLSLKPGNKDKIEMLQEIKSKLKDKYSSEEILSALPAGGISIKK